MLHVSLQEYSVENEDKAMSSLFRFICQLYKVRTSSLMFEDISFESADIIVVSLLDVCFQGIKPPVCTGVPVRLDRGFC